MNENHCPACGEAIATKAINIAEGVALCGSCGQLSKLSEVVSDQRPRKEILDTPPSGCSVYNFGQEILIYASLKSIPGFLGTLFFALFWNGIVSIFVLIALAGLYNNLIGPLPAWFPAPDGGDMPLGMTLFLCVFLIPFVTIGTGVFFACLLNLFGRIEVTVGRTEAAIRTGFGFVNWTRRFDPTVVHRVEHGLTSWRQNDERKALIQIEANKTIKFGTMLTTARREWMHAVLYKLFLEKDSRSDRNREDAGPQWDRS